eukprot:4012640-Amphidinium_carterae.1
MTSSVHPPTAPPTGGRPRSSLALNLQVCNSGRLKPLRSNRQTHGGDEANASNVTKQPKKRKASSRNNRKRDRPVEGKEIDLLSGTT